MDFRLSDELLTLQAEVRDVAQRAAAAETIREDSWIRGFSRAFSRELGERGWLGMVLPVEEGGHGRPPIERFIVTEALIEAGAPIGATWVGDRQIGPTLVEFGTPEQRQRFLPGIIDGTACWSIGLSEPDAGSDLAAVRTRATLDRDQWVIEGQKVWTSFARDADYVYLVTRTDPDAPPHRGMSEIIVPFDTPGIEVKPIPEATGEAHFNEVVFDGARVPTTNLVGALNGSFKQVMRQLEHERAGIDRLMSNQAIYRDALETVDTRDPAVRQRIADLEIGLRVGRMLVIREVLEQAPAGFSAATKVFCTELMQRIANFIASVHPESMIWGRRARAICYSPAYTIQGGTSEILRNVLAERVLGLPR
jgi:alkylation response protein AidB-like acyl-CoA dehydrogenase